MIVLQKNFMDCNRRQAKEIWQVIFKFPGRFVDRVFAVGKLQLL